MATSLRNRGERGDTIIEVLLAIAILSLVIVGGSTLINVGMQNAINSVEHTQVRNLIAGQAELLRYMRDNADLNANDTVSNEYKKLLLPSNNFVNNSTNITDITACSPNGVREPFYLTAEYNGVDQKPNVEVNDYPGGVGDSRPYAVPGRRLWVEGVASPAGVSPAYVDFHIRACWSGTGTSVEQQSNTIVRLYV